MPLSDFILKIKRAETPLYARIKSVAKFFLQADLGLPSFLVSIARKVYALHFGIWFAARWLLAVFYNTPLFRARCESTGRGLFVFLLPRVIGHTRIHLGNGVRIEGMVGITSGQVFDDPTLIIKDRVFIGHQVQFVVNREILVEEDVLIAGRCTFADTDAHPHDFEARSKGAPPPQQEVRPVRICRNAWIGEGAMIRKGVTIGEGAIIGAGSVVLRDVPPFCIAHGNPARVVGFAPRKTSSENVQE